MKQSQKQKNFTSFTNWEHDANYFKPTCRIRPAEDFCEQYSKAAQLGVFIYLAHRPYVTSFTPAFHALTS